MFDTYITCPVIALRRVADADGDIIEAMFMVTISAAVTSIPSKCLMLILEVPALPGLVALVANQSEELRESTNQKTELYLIIW